VEAGNPELMNGRDAVFLDSRLRGSDEKKGWADPQPAQLCGKRQKDIEYWIDKMSALFSNLPISAPGTPVTVLLIFASFINS
jgi:hypothetical protein